MQTYYTYFKREFAKKHGNSSVLARFVLFLSGIIYLHSEAKPKPPRQVAPSPPRYACYLSRFNGRAYSRKGGFPWSIYYCKIKSACFAFPGDVSLALNMTQLSLRDPLWVVAIPKIGVRVNLYRQF